MLMNSNGEVMINQCIYGHTMFRQSRMKICEISTEILVLGHVQDFQALMDSMSIFTCMIKDYVIGLWFYMHMVIATENCHL